MNPLYNMIFVWIGISKKVQSELYTLKVASKTVADDILCSDKIKLDISYIIS